MLCLALLTAFLCLAAPAPQQKHAGSPPAAPQNAGRQNISPEALFAAMLVDAEKGQPRAMLTVGTFYEQGTGVPRNFTKAFEWYGKAAEAGDREGWMRLGACHEIGVGVTAGMDAALAAYAKAADMGFAPAQYKLADMYLRGDDKR